jgi:hypothetical protein
VKRSVKMRCAHARVMCVRDMNGRQPTMYALRKISSRAFEEPCYRPRLVPSRSGRHTRLQTQANHDGIVSLRPNRSSSRRHRAVEVALETADVRSRMLQNV